MLYFLIFSHLHGDWICFILVARPARRRYRTRPPLPVLGFACSLYTSHLFYFFISRIKQHTVRGGQAMLAYRSTGGIIYWLTLTCLCCWAVERGCGWGGVRRCAGCSIQEARFPCSLFVTSDMADRFSCSSFMTSDMVDEYRFLCSLFISDMVDESERCRANHGQENVVSSCIKKDMDKTWTRQPQASTW